MSRPRESTAMELSPPRAWVPDAADRQAGVFTLAQAIDAGLSVGQIRHRRRTGLWVRHAGAAWRHRDRRTGPFADAMAALLTWPDGIVCLHTAARVHRIPVDPGPISTVVPHGRRPRHGLRPVRYALRDEDVVEVSGIAVTSVARTVFDLLGRAPQAQAEALLTWVLTRQRVEHGALTGLVDRSPGMAGNAQRRRLLHATRDGAMGAAEQRLHRLLRRAGIVGWSPNTVIRDRHGIIGTVDVVFTDAWLVLEIDGFAYHGADRFQSDRTRQNRLVGAGYTVLRFTWHDLVDRPHDVVAQVCAALARAA